MRIAADLKRWIETLATVLLAWHERRREQHALTVAFENQQVVVRETRSGVDITRPHDRAEQRVSADLTGRGLATVLSLQNFLLDKVVRRDITVPAGAQKFLSGVIRNQIERLSPWPPNNVVYGFNGEVEREKMPR